MSGNCRRIFPSFLARDIRDGRFSGREKYSTPLLVGDPTFSIASLGHCGLMCCPTRQLRTVVERKRVEQELALAEETQRSLRRRSLPQFAAIRIQVFYRPTRHLGGDLCDFISLRLNSGHNRPILRMGCGREGGRMETMPAVTFNVTGEDLDVLVEVLQTAQARLQVEIQHTFHHVYRDGLRRRLTVIEHLIDCCRGQ
jgi:hypothetical protein